MNAKNLRLSPGLLAVTILIAAQALPVNAQDFNLIMAFDTDRNGSVTRAEFEAAKARRFDQRDADGNGVVTRAEFDEANRMMQERMATAGFSAPSIGGNGRRDPFTRLDENGDGSISEAEFMANDGAFITRADSNGDGVTTAAEVDAFMQRLQRFMNRG